MRLLAFLLVVAAVLHSGRAVACSRAIDEVPAFAQHEAPLNGVFWVRGTRELGPFDLERSDGARVAAEIVSAGGFSSLAIAVPEDAVVGDRYRLRGFLPDDRVGAEEPTLVVIEGTPALEGDLELATPRVTFRRVLGSTTSAFVLPNPLALLGGDSCTPEHAPLLWIGDETWETRAVVAFDVSTPDLVVLDAGHGDLSGRDDLIFNAEPSSPTMEVHVVDGRELLARLRSRSTGRAGAEIAIPLPAPQSEPSRLRVSACGCSQHASPFDVSPYAALGLVLVLVTRRRRTRA